MMPWKIAKGLYMIAADASVDLEMRYDAARFLIGAKGSINTPPKSEIKKLKGITTTEISPEIQAILNQTADRRRRKEQLSQCK